jgi:hypothetical protein
MENLARIFYSSDKKKAFVVHMGKGRVIELKQAPNGLYCYKPKNSFDTRNLETKEISIPNTLAERKNVLTNRQMERRFFMFKC